MSILDTISDALRETYDAITAERDREIGIFIIPFIVALAATGSAYTVFLNGQSSQIVSSITQSGICNTAAPYYVTSIVGGFNGNPLAEVSMCQVASFNPLVLLAWYAELMGLELVAIFIFEMIFHMG